MRLNTSSCLNAASFLKAVFKPEKEKNIALYIRFIPLFVVLSGIEFVTIVSL